MIVPGWPCKPCHMERYRILFFNHAGAVFKESAFDAADDDDAARYAASRHSSGDGMGYEIRLGKYLVQRVIFSIENKAA